MLKNASAATEPVYAVSHHRLVPLPDSTTTAIVFTNVRIDFTASADSSDPRFSMLCQVFTAEKHSGKSPVVCVQVTARLADKAFSSSLSPAWGKVSTMIGPFGVLPLAGLIGTDRW